MLVDRPPARGAAGELHALRSVFRIDAGRVVRVTVAKRAAAPQNVDIVVYARTPAAAPDAAVRVVIDGGAPARITGTALARWTLADRTLPLPPADRPATLGFANIAGGGVLYPRLIVIALGDDLAAGTHTIDLSVTGAAGVWGRFFTLENAPIAPRALPVARRDRHQRGKPMTDATTRHARWILLVALTGTACSRAKCTDRPKAEPTPPTAPGSAAERPLTLDGYEALVYGPGPQATFAETSSSEHEAIAKLVPRLLEAARAAPPPDPRAWQADAAAAGFQIEVWKLDGQTYWALIEQPGRVRGAGAYIFRVAPPEAGPVILLQAPHNFYDLGTGRLAAELFFGPAQGARPRALFTNTIHRYQLAPGDKKKRKHNPADVAHNPEHAFSIATEAFALAAGGARVIQLHGFGARADEDDGDGDVGSVAMVVSAGDDGGSSPLTAALAAALVAEFGPDVKRFPEDVRFLGATTNAQGRLLRKLDGADFVHVEMSSELRKKLAGSAPLRARLGAILFDTPPARR